MLNKVKARFLIGVGGLIAVSFMVMFSFLKKSSLAVLIHCFSSIYNVYFLLDIFEYTYLSC
ncbi:Uncharacterised protein [Streptococcus gordonii]|nr:Uncharacterised protein [Streptococcus gordonii]